jgi:competence protein ComEC
MYLRISIYLSLLLFSVYLHKPSNFIEQWQGAVAPLEGVVINVPKKQRCYQSFLFKTSKGNMHLSAYDCDSRKIEVGDKITLKAKLKPTHFTENPGVINAKYWSKNNNIVANGVIVNVDNITHKNSNAFILLQRLRQRLAQKVTDEIAEKKVSAIILALTLGIKSQITWQQMQVFNHVGVRHLLAISGLHVAMVLGVVYLLLFSFLRIALAFQSRFRVQAIAAFFCIIVAVIYGLFAGASVPTVRACLMFSLVMVCLIREINISWLYLWCASAGLILLFQPFDVMMPSFWLSFMAIAIIAYVYFGRLTINKHWCEYVKLQLGLSLGLLGISLFCFSQFSIVGVFVNLVAVPWVSFIILPLSFFFELTFFWPIAWLKNFLLLNINAFINFLQFFDHEHYGVFYQHVSLGFAIGLFIAALIVLMPKALRIKNLALLCFLPIVLQRSSIEYGQVQLTALAVGQGLSVVLQTQHHLVIYDAGPKFMTGGDMGQYVVLPYLHYLGKTHIDKLVISHGDSDHFGGANTLLDYFTVSSVLTSAPEKFSVAITSCLAGQTWQWDGVVFDVLYPDKWHQHLGNNSSCVLRVRANNQSVLLVGDLEAIAEANLVKTYGSALNVDVLVAPHHGSNTSSTPGFVDAVAPKKAILSYGFMNHYHFPGSAVIKRYKAKDVEVLATQDKSVTLIPKRGN